MTEQCHPVYDQDGQLVAVVRSEEPLGPDGEAAMRELIAAASRRFAADDRDGSRTRKQAKARERTREMRRRIRGDNR